jgi:organic radical activating enzyme
MAVAIRLEHGRPELARVTLVDWTLGNCCNYACSYCPAGLHDGSIAWPALMEVRRFVERVSGHYRRMGREVLFQFTGGEPTVYPRFLELLACVKGCGCRAGVISNGSRTLRWWGEARALLDQVVLTHHVEFVELEHFIAVARCVAGAVRTHVNVTMHPGRFDQCVAAAERIAAECADVTLTLKPLLVGFGAEMYPYTAGQREVIERRRFEIRRTRAIEETRGLMRMTYDDGASELVKPAQLIVRGLNRFKGWSCEAGMELLAIDARGRVFRGLCREGGMVGRISDEEIALPRGAVTCTLERCHCATDLMTTRCSVGSDLAGADVVARGKVPSAEADPANGVGVG